MSNFYKVFSTIVHGQKAVTTSGTGVALASSSTPVNQGVWIKALQGNSGFIYVGLNGVATSTGYQLDAAESVFIPIADLSTIYIDCSVNGEGVSYIGF